MAHADERLLDRALPVEAERAYALLRDPAALARFVAGEAERVALPLGPPGDCAYLIVTREGRSVTCLGAGMAFSTPKRDWQAVEGFLAAKERALRLRMAAARLRTDEDAAETFHESIKNAWRMTREDFDVLRTLAPLLERDLVERIADVVMLVRKVMLRSARTPAFPTLRAARAAFRLYSGAATELMACKDGPNGILAAFAACRAQDVWLASRGMWILVNHPTRTMEVVERVLTNSRRLNAQSLVPLLIIAHRFSWLRREALALLRRTMPGVDELIASFDALVAPPALVSAMAMGTMWFIVDGLELTGGPVAPDDAFIARMKGLQGKFEKSATLDDVMARLAPELLPAARAMDVMREAYREPITHPRHEAALAKDEIVRIELWRLGLCGSWLPAADDPLRALFATLAPIEALIPGSGPPPMNIDLGVELMTTRLAAMGAEDRKPVEKAPAVGRNEPCPCGSGKKSKKCCAG